MAVRRRGRKRATGTRAPMALQDGPNQHWRGDFKADTPNGGRPFRILCIVDDFNRGPCRRIDAGVSIKPVIAGALDPSCVGASAA